MAARRPKPLTPEERAELEARDAVHQWAVLMARALTGEELVRFERLRFSHRKDPRKLLKYYGGESCLERMALLEDRPQPSDDLLKKSIDHIKAMEGKAPRSDLSAEEVIEKHFGGRANLEAMAKASIVSTPLHSTTHLHNCLRDAVKAVEVLLLQLREGAPLDELDGWAEAIEATTVARCAVLWEQCNDKHATRRFDEGHLDAYRVRLATLGRTGPVDISGARCASELVETIKVVKRKTAGKRGGQFGAVGPRKAAQMVVEEVSGAHLSTVRRASGSRK